MARCLPLLRLDLHAAPRETPGGAQVVAPSLGHDPATLLDRDPAHSHLFSCCRRLLHQVELLPLLPCSSSFKLAPLALSVSPRHRQLIGGLWGAAHTVAVLAKAATRKNEDFSRDVRVPGAVAVHVTGCLSRPADRMIYIQKLIDYEAEKARLVPRDLICSFMSLCCSDASLDWTRGPYL